MRKSKSIGLKKHNHDKVTNKPYNLLKKTAITTVIGLGVTVSAVYADTVKDLSTIYHVYVDGEHVGTVDNKNLVNNYMNNLIEEKQSDFEDYDLIIGENVSFVPEMVFEKSSKNSEVIDVLDEELTVKVDAYELKLGDKVVGYFKDEKTAEETITNLKEKYVDPEILAELEEKKADETEQEKITIAVGDSKIIDVQLSEKVSLSKEKVLPKEIITVEEGLKLLEKGTLEDKIHTVEEGDVLVNIASQYNLELDDIFEMNADIDEDTLLQIGQEINVTDYEPYVDVVVKKEELIEEEISYQTETITSDELFKGQTKVQQQGQEGKKEVHYEIETVNGNVIKRDVVEETITKEPVKEIIVKGTKVIPSRGTAQFKWPTVGGYISSHVGYRWGSYHKGLDIAGVSNRTIMAADNGVVQSAGWDGGYGNKIVINHQNGYKTVYAHLSSINVSVGQTVPKGSKIGVMGSTGNSTGIHLHFEVYKNGALINPNSLF